MAITRFQFPEVDEKMIQALIEYGHEEKFIRKLLGITAQRWCDWKRVNPRWAEKLEDWKKTADARVEKALYERAIGYRAEVQEVDGNGDLRVVEKVWPPDVPAQIFWLCNRQKEHWKKDTQIEVKSDNKHEISVDRGVLDEIVKQVLGDDAIDS